MKTAKQNLAIIPSHHVKKNAPQDVGVRKRTDLKKTLKILFPPIKK